MGDAYVVMVTSDRTRLLTQMQAYAACDDAEVREAMRTGYGKLHLFVETVSGLPQEARRPVVREGDAPERRRRDGSREHARALGATAGRRRDRVPTTSPRRSISGAP